MSPLKVLVIQMGARRAYELANMLEERSALVGLETGTAWPAGSDPWLKRLLPSRTGAIDRRIVSRIPAEKLRSSPLPEVVGGCAKLLGLRSDIRFGMEDWVLGATARARGLAGANVVLTTLGNGGLSFLAWAKKQGLRIATDVFITPVADEVEAAEHGRWPGWERSQISRQLIASNRAKMTRLVELSDLLLCPSETVVDGLRTIPTFDPAKAVLLPYGLGDVVILRGNPRPRRILFAGNASLRKGIPYLAQAASMLHTDGYEFRVAGAVSASVASRVDCAHLTFLGKLSRIQMAKEFGQADIFCLPSLAEGMASVSLEALASGVPCVVTRAAGAPVVHGHNGLIVPERDPAALAAAIRCISEDRDVRRSMSRHAVETSRRHRDSVIGDGLFHALNKLVRPQSYD